MPPRHLYIHVPFCARRCSYCDFSIAVRREVPVSAFVRQIAAELARRAPRDEAWELDTLYLGGGTPSLLGGAGVAALVAEVRNVALLAVDAEFTIEANPDDVHPAAVAAWRTAGVNRISIGVQSFDPGVLTWMHRTHTREQIGHAFRAAHEEGIGNLSLDLIFALPPQVSREWGRDLEEALALEPAHLSLYGLTVEPATMLHRWQGRGLVTETEDERYAEEFLAADTRLTLAGFTHYEVSNYARPGAESRHNASYWRRVPYEGVGPSAHAFDGQRRRWNIAPYAAWARAIDDGRDPAAGDEVLSDEAEHAEDVYLGLRSTRGVEASADVVRRASRWLDMGWAVRSGDRLRLTPTGWLRLDSLAADLTLVGSR